MVAFLKIFLPFLRKLGPKLGRCCGATVEHSPSEHEVEGLNPAWIFSSFLSFLAV